MSGEPRAIRTVHVRIEGRVQGVWFRGWAARAAERLDLDGWVRNRHDRSVEAVFSGAPDAVAEMLRHCEQGPPGARVTRVTLIQDGGGVPRGFEIKPSV